MENEYDKRIDEWFSTIGPEKFTAITNLIDDTVEKVGEITPKDEFLAAVEAKLFRLAAHVVTIEQFMKSIGQEYENCIITADGVTKIDPLLREFISNPLISSEVQKDNNTDLNKKSDASSPADMLARLNQSMTKPTTIAPIKREYTTTPSPRSPVKLDTDPYREDVSTLG